MLSRAKSAAARSAEGLPLPALAYGKRDTVSGVAEEGGSLPGQFADSRYEDTSGRCLKLGLKRPTCLPGRRNSALGTGNGCTVRAVIVLGVRGIVVDEGRAKSGGESSNSHEDFTRPRLRFPVACWEGSTGKLIIRCGANV